MDRADDGAVIAEELADLVEDAVEDVVEDAVDEKEIDDELDEPIEEVDDVTLDTLVVESVVTAEEVGGMADVAKVEATNDDVELAEMIEGLVLLVDVAVVEAGITASGVEGFEGTLFTGI